MEINNRLTCVMMCESHWAGDLSSATVVAGDCSAGSIFDGMDCKACPVGSYQDKKYQMSCKSCGKMMTTEKEGAKSMTKCFCEYI